MLQILWWKTSIPTIWVAIHTEGLGRLKYGLIVLRVANSPTLNPRVLLIFILEKGKVGLWVMYDFAGYKKVFVGWFKRCARSLGARVDMGCMVWYGVCGVS